MSAVPLKEVVEALRKGIPVGAFRRFDWLEANKKLVERIEQHGIAPPDGWVLVAEVVRNDTGQIRVVDAKGDSFDMSKFIGVKLYAAPEVSE